MVKQTVLHATHKALGAHMVPFAGYDMPVRYTGDKQEHMAVRQAAGMFDVSHMGEFIIRGPKALQLIQTFSSNDASKLVPGKAHYSCMPNHEGGIVDDIIVYHIREDQYMVVVNASNIEKDWNWISESNRQIGAELIDISEETALIAVSGPKAEAVVQQFTDWDLSALPAYACIKGDFHGAPKSLIATTGYTGERTFEIFLYQDHAVRIWNDLQEAGQAHGLIPAGLGARDTLRLEMGYMLYGNDINDSTSPIDAGLGWITKLNKGEFNGKAAILARKAAGLGKKLAAFCMAERGIPRRDYEIVKEGLLLGTVSSGSVSPVTGVGIGMGYVPASEAVVGNEIQVRIRNKDLQAVVVKPPMIPRV